MGLSDHTPGHATVLSIALGARIIENISQMTTETGLIITMNPKSWKEMVLRSRELELSLGIETKKVEDNETETVVLQRRSMRAKRNIKRGENIHKEDFAPLRPCPKDAMQPWIFNQVLGRKIKRDISKHDYIKSNDV